MADSHFQCLACTLINDAGAVVCVLCGTSRPGFHAPSLEEQAVANQAAINRLVEEDNAEARQHQANTKAQVESDAVVAANMRAAEATFTDTSSDAAIAARLASVHNLRRHHQRPRVDVLVQGNEHPAFAHGTLLCLDSALRCHILAFVALQDVSAFAQASVICLVAATDFAQHLLQLGGLSSLPQLRGCLAPLAVRRLHAGVTRPGSAPIAHVLQWLRSGVPALMSLALDAFATLACLTWHNSGDVLTGEWMPAAVEELRRLAPRPSVAAIAKLLRKHLQLEEEDAVAVVQIACQRLDVRLPRTGRSHLSLQALADAANTCWEAIGVPPLSYLRNEYGERPWLSRSIEEPYRAIPHVTETEQRAAMAIEDMQIRGVACRTHFAELVEQARNNIRSRSPVRNAP